MRKQFVSLALGIALIVAWAGIAVANDCDPAFKGMEAYSCKMGRQEFKVGLKKDTRSVCVELKEIKIDGCDVEPAATMPDIQYVYFVGPKSEKKKFMSYDFQCDNEAGNMRGGMSKGNFEGYLHPDYTIGKFPGESNADRQGRFLKDLEKQDKALYGSLIISDPVNKYAKKYDKQVCQYFNPKTNKVALRFSCTVNMPGEKGGASVEKGEAPGERGEAPGSKKEDMMKGLKGLFGR